MGWAKCRIAIGAIFKNEAPYILEWIAFHRLVGVEHFFIADNDSDDGSADLLRALKRVGLITLIRWPSRAGESPQLPAYKHILERYGARSEWMAFIDADEFLVPSAGKTLPNILDGLAIAGDVGAVCVNWATYGSSGRLRPGTGLVLERFDRRAPSNFGPNRHYKSIVRPAACVGPFDNPHHFELLPGYRHIDVKGGKLELQDGRVGISRTASWDPLRINHYVIKSRDEFFMRKRRRGRATTQTSDRNSAFFAAHDCNDEEDPFDPELLVAVKREAMSLQERLRARGFVARQPLPDGELSKRRPWRGSLDQAALDGAAVVLRGWAITAAGAPVETFGVIVGEHSVVTAALTRRRRADVVAAFPIADPDCGFELSFSLFGLPAEALESNSIKVIARIDGDPFALKLPHTPHFVWPHDGVKRILRAASEVPDRPLLPGASAGALLTALAGARVYLEYGTGGSTVQAAKLGLAGLIAVESDRAWLDAVRWKMADLAVPEHVHLIHADIGPTKELGYPASEQNWRQYHAYALAPWDHCRSEGFAPDVVLIDGRFRVASFLATLLHAPVGCRVFFDDYLDRPHYHGVERFLARQQTFDRMAEFIVPPDLPRDGLWRALVEALTDPR